MCQGETAETNKKNRAGHKHQSGATEKSRTKVRSIRAVQVAPDAAFAQQKKKWWCPEFWAL
jgi:hypothetical protein